jgi:hypothetical protein
MIVLTTLLGIITSFVALAYLPAPFVWNGLVWFVVFLHASLLAKKQLIKAVWFNIGFCFLLLGGLEAYLWVFPDESERIEGSYTQEYFTEHDLLGYAPIKGKSVTSEKYFEERLIYDVVYSIDEKGLRVSPPHEPGESNECILFFGGSLAFGEGVNDNEAMPYLVGTKSNYRVLNFGFHGYGPHQMLASLGKGLVENIVDCEPKYAIYVAIIPHIARSAGYSSWDRHGPRYVMDADGSVSFVGHIDEQEVSLFLEQIKKSFIYKRYFTIKTSFSKADIDLFIGIVQASRNAFLKQYPGGEFHVLLWGKPVEAYYKYYPLVLNGMRSRGIQVHQINDLLTGDKSLYEINKHDKHFNPMALERIADYVVDHILNEKPLAEH